MGNKGESLSVVKNVHCRQAFFFILSILYKYTIMQHAGCFFI